MGQWKCVLEEFSWRDHDSLKTGQWNICPGRSGGGVGHCNVNEKK
jgi:hypothetical protein